MKEYKPGEAYERGQQEEERIIAAWQRAGRTLPEIMQFEGQDLLDELAIAQQRLATRPNKEFWQNHIDWLRGALSRLD